MQDVTSASHHAITTASQFDNTEVLFLHNNNEIPLFVVFISVTKASTYLLLLHLRFLLFGEGSNKSHTRSSLNLLHRDTWDHGTMAGECRRLDRWKKEMCESKQKPLGSKLNGRPASACHLALVLADRSAPQRLCPYKNDPATGVKRNWRRQYPPNSEQPYEAWQAVTGSMPEICLLWIWSPSTGLQWID